jgi:S-adenosylmethionine:tRNA ribosyltransferase-isomerase
MTLIKDIKIEDYDYKLPDERIAKYPLASRDASKLLVYKQGQISQSTFNQISNLLPADSLLVSNNTKVIRARLEFFKETGSRIEIFCLEPHQPTDYALAFAQNVSCEWSCIVGNSKKWKNGELKKELSIGGIKAILRVQKLDKVRDEQIILFSWDNKELTFSDILEHEGNIPIPPYLNRKAEDADLETYQTIYSKHKGSVAAPTAGLHFTSEVFASLKAKRIKQHEVTLHVGAGTFKPVKSETIGAHEMHAEHFVITAQTIPILLQYIGNVTAVGTTTVRTLESLYWLGVKRLSGLIQREADLYISQWDAYNLPQNYLVKDALQALHQYFLNTGKVYLNAITAIMIAPGYNFRLIDRLITNFHQPKSTLLLLIGAFIGEDWKKAYAFALESNFRFLSYGDSCLLIPIKKA